MNGTDRAYAAGILDGEGSIWFDMVSGTGTGSLNLQVSMTTREVPEWLHRTFGGGFHVRNNSYGKVYTFILHGVSCQPFLEQIKEFVKLKTPQVDVALAFCKTLRPKNAGGGWSRTLDERVLLYRLKLVEVMTELNAKQKKVNVEQEVKS